METFLDLRSREKCVQIRNGTFIKGKITRGLQKGINDIQIRKSMFALDKKLHRFFFSIILGVFLNQSLSLR